VVSVVEVAVVSFVFEDLSEDVLLLHPVSNDAAIAKHKNELTSFFLIIITSSLS
jgi:hypothetical protein